MHHGGDDPREQDEPGEQVTEALLRVEQQGCGQAEQGFKEDRSPGKDERVLDGLPVETVRIKPDIVFQAHKPRLASYATRGHTDPYRAHKGPGDKEQHQHDDGQDEHKGNAPVPAQDLA